jgi:positive regulator of sigma E activity
MTIAQLSCDFSSLFIFTEDNQAVLDAEGYAECPDCGARIHCGTVGIQNLEKRH